jgi:methionyl-tRNA formyltransferase
MQSPKVRVAVFGSFYRGFYLLHEMLHGPIADRIEVVGVATDDPSSTWVAADRRVWQYPHTPAETTLVADLAQAQGLDVYTGKVNSEPFHAIIEQQWRPDICIMGTFGQRIKRRLIDVPRLGFYNLHPCIDDTWPSKYIGGNPFDALMRDGKTYTCVVMHQVDEGFDTGPFVAISDRIAIPPGASVTDMHKITSFSAAQLAGRCLLETIERDRKAYA